MFERKSGIKLSCKSAKRTHQSFAKDADINNIMAKYRKTGILVDPLLINSKRQPRFGDFRNVPDFANTLSTIKQAESDFMTLPAEVRAKFKNDVSICVEFMSNPDNLVASIDLGLLPESLRPKPVPKELEQPATPAETPIAA